MKKDLPLELSADLLDEFFSEADEHLLGIREAMVQLESSVGKAQPDPKQVEKLYRDFHSFKGISGLVGLGPAESLAHSTEDYLRLLKTGRTQLSTSGLEVLMKSAQKLEQIVVAFRRKRKLPTGEEILSLLKDECQRASAFDVPAKSEVLQPTPSDDALLKNVEEAKAEGMLLWKYTFSPTQATKALGVSIATVREELAKLGKLLKSTPLVKGKGVIAFEFLVAAAKAPADIGAWEAKGVSVDLSEDPKIPPVAKTNYSEESELTPFIAPSHIVRVNLKQLDDLMRITGELVIQKSRLELNLNKAESTNAKYANGRELHETVGGIGRSLRHLREAIMGMRLVPVAEIFARMPFVVRDLSRQTQRQVQLKLEGQETAIDKYLIEKLKDPLLHLVRNAFSHGVETAEERLRASKPTEALIELKAFSVGDSVVISIKDDGRGINPDDIIKRAKKLGLEVPTFVDNAALLKILCSSGFSTREEADKTSGRGVGMAVVNSAVRELGGSISMETASGEGTTFTLRFPLTLAITEAFIIAAHGQICAIPQTFVREIRQVRQRDIQVTNGIEVTSYKSGLLPIVRMTEVFKLSRSEKPQHCMLVVSSDRGSVGLLAENVQGQREIVVRTLKDPLIQVAGITGATELGDGKPVLILDGVALTSGQVRPPEPLAIADN